MVNKKPFSKNIFLTLLVILIVSMFLMMNASPLASPISTSSVIPSSPSSSSTPLWGFDGAYMNYSVTNSTNAPPSNLNSIVPQWFFNGAYANYTFNMTSSSSKVTGNYNATIFKVDTTSLTYSVKYAIIETVSGKSTHSTVYVNDTSVASNTQPMSGIPGSTTPFPALSSYSLYMMDSGLLSYNGITIRNGVTFVSLDKTIKSDQYIMTSSSMNESYYVSYGSGLILNGTLNRSGTNLSAQITATNVPLSSPPPFTVGMWTSTAYTKYEILSTAPNGNFTANVTTSTTGFFLSEPGNFNGTFQTPGSMLALNLTDLNQLNAGKVPPGMMMPPNFTVETGVTVTVPAGTFITDKISGSSIQGNASIKFAFYIDSTSGVFTLANLNYSVSVNGHTMIMNESMSLSSTNIPMESTGYGFLKGTITPTGATLVINGMIVPTYNGASYNISLKPGNYYVSASKSGYQTKTYNVNISAGKTTQLNVILAAISNSVTLSGHVTPVGSSVVVDGDIAPVNATGYYTIPVSAGEHTVSVYHDGYFPVSKKIDITSSMTLNFNLLKEPSRESSNMSRNATTAIGYNVTVSGILNGKGLVSVNFTATKNGTLLVSIPYNDMKNATISEILNSSIYINGVRDKNFSITITSNYTVILTVYNLSGDPTLYWAYSPAAVLPTSPPAPFRLSILEDGIIIGAIVAVVALVGVIIVRKKNR